MVQTNGTTAVATKPAGPESPEGDRQPEPHETSPEQPEPEPVLDDIDQHPHSEDPIHAAAYALEAARRRVATEPDTEEDLIFALGKLADLRREDGDYRRAHGLYREAIHRAVEIEMGGENFARLYAGLAWLHQANDEPGKAISNYRVALDILEVETDGTSKLFATIHNNLAVIYRQQENYERSEEHYQKALPFVENQSEGGGSSLAYIYQNLGVLYGVSGQADNAVDYLYKALELRERILPPGHDDILQTLEDLAGAYDQLGDEKLAEKYRRDVERFATNRE